MRGLSLLAMTALLAGCGSPQRQHNAPEAEVASAAPLAELTSASITLPADEETFPGPQGKLLDRTCLACHSVSMVRNQPPLTRQQWTATVTKMHDAYGAPFELSEVDAIVDALLASKVAPVKP
jgi:hypothetical protein